jgi:hypothetical protein
MLPSSSLPSKSRSVAHRCMISPMTMHVQNSQSVGMFQYKILKSVGIFQYKRSSQ